jgi:hypothetical protein
MPATGCTVAPFAITGIANAASKIKLANNFAEANFVIAPPLRIITRGPIPSRTVAAIGWGVEEGLQNSASTGV